MTYNKLTAENWDDYRFFLAVAQTGSLSHASRVLNVTQPTVGRRIDQLEKRHKAQLFTSTPEGMHITVVGNAILSLAKQMEHASILAMNKISDHDLNLSGSITVTSTQSIASNWLAERISKFSKMYPEISVQCIADTRMLNLAKREADVAIRFGVPEPSKLIGSRICDVHCGVYASEDYLKESGIPASITDLVDHKIVGPVGQIGHYRQISEFKEIAAKTARITCETNCPDTYLSLAVAGLGLACLPCFVATRHPQLRRVLNDESDWKIELWMLTHPDIREVNRIRVFLDFVRDELQRDRGIFSGIARSS